MEETENLIGKDPVAGDIREYLRDWYRKISAAEPDTVIEEIGEEKTIEQLKSLGYL